MVGSTLQTRFGFNANVKRKDIENTNLIRASRFLCAPENHSSECECLQCNDDKDLMNFLSDYCVINETIERNITSKCIDCNFGVGEGWYM